jgi:hypothetical protein
MGRSDSEYEILIWTPIIGFDMDKSDRGVDEYYDELGFVPDKISLFLFAPDIVHNHCNLDTEVPLPPDNCNYYGNIRNEKRSIQPWTNYKLRELINNINAKGTEVYAGIMGVYDDADHSSPNHYNCAPQQWLDDHKELMLVTTNGASFLNVLKRFKNGDYYEDFLLARLKVMLVDYGFTGLHAADCICPPWPSIFNGDFSNDMVDQFVSHTGVKLLQSLLEPIEDSDSTGLKRRADYIWNRLRREWIEFNAWRWAAFWKKICDGLHAIGKKVISNNAWCSDPFEAYYRFGIDYKKFYESGVDYIVAESQATAVNSNVSDDNTYRLHQYMTMPMLMRAFAPQGKLLCISGVKDSTEEWNALEHLPSAVEREIYTVANMYIQEGKELARVTDGICVCLGDGITADEWKWQRERWDIGFADAPLEIHTPTLVWSDSAVYDFLDEYIKTRRWSFHKTVHELAEHGAQFACITGIDNLSNVSGAIFVPNVDILPVDQLRAIESYRGGPIICTAASSKMQKLDGLGRPDVYFEDPCVGYKLCIFAYNMPSIDYAKIIETLGQDDGTPDIVGEPMYAAEPVNFHFSMTYRKVSSGFVSACARLIRQLYTDVIYTDEDGMMISMAYGENNVRLLVANENRLQYANTTVHCRRPVKWIRNRSKFPALPAKLLDEKGRVIIPKSEETLIPDNVYSFIVKTVPGGMSILDVELQAAEL